MECSLCNGPFHFIVEPRAFLSFPLGSREEFGSKNVPCSFDHEFSPVCFLFTHYRHTISNVNLQTRGLCFQNTCFYFFISFKRDCTLDTLRWFVSRSKTHLPKCLENVKRNHKFSQAILVNWFLIEHACLNLCV